MPFEEFDKKVNEAADHHYPAYDEKAWEKMEKLLDKHLPQKKDDRRRIIFFLLLFLFAGGGAYLMIAKPWQSRNPEIVAVKKTDQKLPVNTSANNRGDEKEKTVLINAGNDKLNSNINIIEDQKTIVDARKNSHKLIPFISTGMTDNKNKPSALTNNFFNPQEKREVINQKSDENVLKNDDVVTPEIANNYFVDKETNHLSEKNAEEKLNLSDNIDSAQKISNTVVIPGSKKNKPGNRKSGSFFLSLSSGPDISFTGLDELGKTKLVAGAGLGYTFKNNFTLRTGFYTARKIYSAKSYQYHTTYTTWLPNYTLDRVDADCRVYEVPLLLSYNFGHSASHSWLATAGISSYFMKRETYDYQYKNPSGQVYTHQKTMTDENKHYFSVLTLSGGYRQKINNTFSVMAEPYLKIPMVGVGNGKVKLNGAGVLLSVGIKLFGSDKTRAGN